MLSEMPKRGNGAGAGMLTTDELRALVELLERVPMTTAERLWVQALVNRMAELMHAVQEKKSDAT